MVKQTRTAQSTSDNYRINLMFVDPCIIVKFMKKNPRRCKNVSKFYYSIWQPLVFHTWKVVEHVVGGRCQTQYVPDNVQQPATYENPEAASAVLGS